MILKCKYCKNRQCSLRVRVGFKEGQIPGSVNIEYFQRITSIRGKKADDVLTASWRRPGGALAALFGDALGVSCGNVLGALFGVDIAIFYLLFYYLE